ncbi:MAG TPA: tryptophan--tRNA ligase [Candidatus Latescibacteria bacterium]|jgi:tryptophanyl-tRNA synthetase|nr:tryptophan--tRNA ligase [Gemmatimonadaceae bacterium]MDP6014914.1 tryptophan--tRNA ligase [Candidatus Latescibacterota bacterium]HJP33189.1 tryptophan--tRNA ligase [Candidatus Latescibacterota bacterium]
MSQAQRVFSGIKPSGDPHLGNYIGAIRNWVADQDRYDNFFCVVDQHAITVPYDPAQLRVNLRQLAALLVACGIDPERSCLFVQSHVPEHTELAWLLTCTTPMGWLERMTQFKDKSDGSQRERVSAGLFTYPALMAADILLYDTAVVPVGDDQKQHVELARDLAGRFNHMYGEVFTVPEPVIREVGARVMGLDDPTKKMSKSDGAVNRTVDLLDEPKKIMKKFGRAVTDSQTDIVFDENRPGVTNLLTIHQALSGQSQVELETHFSGKGYGDLKKEVAGLVAETFEPIRQRYTELTADPQTLDRILANGAERAQTVAVQTMSRVREAMGLR